MSKERSNKPYDDDAIGFGMEDRNQLLTINNHQQNNMNLNRINNHNDPKFSAEKLGLGIDIIDINVNNDNNINDNFVYDKGHSLLEGGEIKNESLFEEMDNNDNDKNYNISKSSAFADNKDPEKLNNENSVVLSEKNKSQNNSQLAEKLESENKDEENNENKDEENNENKDEEKQPLTESQKIEAEIAIVKTFPLLKTQEDASQRLEIFQKLKQKENDNETIKPDEIDKGLRDLYSFEEKFLTKDVISRAFFSSKKSKIKRYFNTEDEMEKNELRSFLVYLRQYAEYFEMFDLIETQDSKKIKFEEFSSALPVLSKWGIEIEDPKSAFDGIDTEGNGEILFQEFCHWAIKKNLELECEDENFDDEVLAKDE